MDEEARNSEARFTLGDDDYVKTQLQATYNLVLRAEITASKEQKIKYLLVALGNIRDVLKRLGVETSPTD